MDNTLLSAIIGGAIASVPAIITTTLNFIDSLLKRRHEESLRLTESYDKAKTDALRAYGKSLGRCLLLSHKELSVDQVHTLTQDYFEAYENLFLYVSDDTQKAMISLGDPLGWSVDDHDVVRLNQCLAAEMRSVVNDLPHPGKHRKPVRRDAGCGKDQDSP